MMQVSPRVDPRLVKTSKVATALTDGELESLKAAAVGAGQHFVEWLRDLALKASRPKAEYFERGEGQRRNGVMFKVTPEQRAAIYAAAEAMGVSPSSFIRAAALAEARRLGIR